MQSAEQPLRGAARAVRPDRLSKLMWLVAAVMAVAGLSGCAEPSPQVQVATADASQSATASSDSAGHPAANESAAAATAEPEPNATDATAPGDATPPATTADNSTPQAATAEPEPNATDATAAGDATPPATTADNSTPPAAPSTPPAEPQAASEPAPAAPATEAPRTAAAPEPAPSQTAGGAADVHPPGSGLATGRPYVVIRFTESSIDYEKTLAEAVKRAVARKPNLAFDLVAVTPRAGTADELAELTNQAHAEAEAVMKSLSALGIGPERVSMMTWTGQPTDVNEIRLYIR
jgi:hypothetical protein